MAVSGVNGPFFYLTSVPGLTVDTLGISTSIDPVKYPVSNSLDRLHPLRLFLSTETANPQNFSVRYYVPVGVTIDGIFVDNTNVDGELFIKTISSANAHTTRTPAQTATVQKDNRVGRRKCFVTFSPGLYFDGTANQRLYVGFKSGAVVNTVNGLTTVYVGAVSTYTNMGNNMIVYPGGYINDIDIDVELPTSEVKFDGGCPEFTEIGEPYIYLNFPDRTLLEETQESTFFNIIYNRTSPVLYFENEANHSHAYCCKLDQTKATKYKYLVRGKVFSSSISLVECL